MTITVQARPQPTPTPDEPTEPDPADTTPPVFTSSASASVNENQTSAITLVATDASAVTYSISAADAGSFTVNASTGVVTFNTAPDFETKTSYTFTAKATDASSNEANQAVTITILDVACENPVTHNGTMYCTVVSPYTGKVWLDRNLGAARVCTSFNDTACYGDYYQWGRNFDGHEDSASATTDMQATDVNDVGHGNFIESNSTYDLDWAKEVDSDGSLRQANWSKTDGSSICPVGFRVPTITELRTETLDSGVQDAETGFNNFLKLPTAGHRYYSGNIPSGGVLVMWSSSLRDSARAPYVEYRSVVSGHIWSSYSTYASGLSVRCLKGL